MAKFLLKTAKIVGTATANSWSQVHLFSPAEGEKQQKRGQLLTVLSLHGLGEGVEAVAAGREVISRFHEEYYGNLEGRALTRLERAVKKVTEEGKKEATIEIGAAVVLGQALYLVIAGQGQAILRRNGQVGTLFQGSGGVTSASGYLQSGDLFLLGTASFFQAIAGGVIKAALATGSPTEATEILAPAVHGRPKSGTVAVVVGQVKTKEAEEKKATFFTPPAKRSQPDRKAPLLRFNLQAKIMGFLTRLQRLWGQKAIYLKKPLTAEVQEGGTSLRRGWLLKLQRRLRQKPARAKRTSLTVAIILLVLLGASVILGASQRKRLGWQTKTASLLAQAQEKVSEGEGLLELNPLRARELFLEAQQLATQIEAEKVRSAEFKQFQVQLAQLLDQVIKEHEVQAEAFFDLELIKQAAKGDDWAFSGGRAIVLDQGKNSVYELGLTDKKSAILAGGKSLTTATQVAAFWPQIFILTEEGVIQVEKGKSRERVVVEADESWDKVIDLQAFGGNLYSLDKKGIWRYPSLAEGGLGNKQRWLKGSSNLDFSQAVAMAIDGSIWVLKADGGIWKFTQGKKDFFGLAGLPEPLGQPSALYTDDDAENLYLLDKGNNSLVVIAKSGEYEATYFWAGLGEINDLIADEAEAKIFLLGGNKIYVMESK